jgi:histidinol-phosphate/aromatic aminotransferase/cobyric acid decarboxylase-like protein
LKIFEILYDEKKIEKMSKNRSLKKSRSSTEVEAKSFTTLQFSTLVRDRGKNVTKFIRVTMGKIEENEKIRTVKVPI